MPPRRRLFPSRRLSGPRFRTRGRCGPGGGGRPHNDGGQDRRRSETASPAGCERGLHRSFGAPVGYPPGECRAYRGQEHLARTAHRGADDLRFRQDGFPRGPGRCADRQRGTAGGDSRERQALDVISSFLSAKRADELRQVAEEIARHGERPPAGGGDQYEFGVVAKNDVLAADVQVANAESTLIVAENQAELSRSGWRCGWAIPGTGPTPAPGPFPVPPEGAPPLSESLRAALEKRNELHAHFASLNDTLFRLTDTDPIPGFASLPKRYLWGSL